MRKPIIAGNWKMNKTASETIKLIEEIKSNELDSNVESVVIVPFTNIQSAIESTKNSNIKVGAQNMYFEESGAFTGEVSPLMLKDLNVEYVVLGHSERREIFGESDELINNKVESALKHDLKPILCCGETLSQRENKEEEIVVEAQLTKDLKNVSDNDMEKIVIAYEPIWAIGTGKTASSDDAQNMCAFIRSLIEKLYSKSIAEKVRIQYGGSVKPENVKDIMSKNDIDGALVGGASLQAKSFSDLVNYKK